ncbi:MAG TPA: DUF2793 domain-containing protein [Sphingomonas sp.]|jgi:hypothetical protein|uniref:DUF2793 domain-containing protein n=1 Tax=Sphingomonas sp. TaxID=28214 RepID=UPI002EDA1F19
MTDATERFELPWIMTGQAQKEVTHNEALARVDMLLHPVAESMVLATPPADPGAGRTWIVAAGGTGAWAGRTGSLAIWTEGGWRFAAPVSGMLVWLIDQGRHVRWTGSAWTAGPFPTGGVLCDGIPVVGRQQPGIIGPTGGPIADIEARATIFAILDTLRNHGLITT